MDQLNILQKISHEDIFFSLQISKIHIKIDLLPKFQENINE